MAMRSLTKNNVVYALLRSSSSTWRGTSHLSVRPFSSNNSFMRSVMDQVKKEMENNPELKKAMNDFQKNKKDKSEPTFTENMSDKFNDAKEKATNVKDSTSKLYENIKSKINTASSSFNQMAEENPSLKATKDALGKVSSSVSSLFKKTIDITQQGINLMNVDKDNAKARAEKWKEDMASQRSSTQSAAESTDPSSEPTNSTSSSSASSEEEYSLVLSHESTWDRFGFKLKDMPFLNSFLDNPVLSSILKESATAKAIRKQKELDPSFFMPEFCELVEHIIAPKTVEAFLNEDIEFMNRHLGKGCQISWLASIRDRKLNKLKLDNSILLLRNVEMKGAQCSQDPEENEMPSFVWMFSTQQINCLRNEEGKIVQGAIDDIREVHYALALKRHPNPQLEGLEFPYEVSEFAIVGNNPVW